jgi:hypothetical protein
MIIRRAPLLVAVSAALVMAAAILVLTMGLGSRIAPSNAAVQSEPPYTFFSLITNCLAIRTTPLG